MVGGADYNGPTGTIAPPRTRTMMLNHFCARTRLSVLILVLLGVAAPSARAYDFVKDSLPNRWIQPLVPEDLPDLKYPAYYNDVDKARAQFMAGRYRRSLVTLANAKDADPPETALIKGGALATLGGTDARLGPLTAEKVKDEPRAQTLRARILTNVGRTDDAKSILREHLKTHPDSIAGHFYLAQVSEQTGDLGAARAAYNWFVDDQRYLDKWQGNSGESAFDDAESVTLIGRGIDRWASITGAYKDNAPLHNAILNMFVKAYDVID